MKDNTIIDIIQDTAQVYNNIAKQYFDDQSAIQITITLSEFQMQSVLSSGFLGSNPLICLEFTT